MTYGQAESGSLRFYLWNKYSKKHSKPYNSEEITHTVIRKRTYICYNCKVLNQVDGNDIRLNGAWNDH